MYSANIAHLIYVVLSIFVLPCRYLLIIQAEADRNHLLSSGNIRLLYITI